MDVQAVIFKGVDSGASDTHIQAGSKLTCRIHGSLRKLNAPALEPDEVESFFRSVISEEQWEELLRERHLDFAWQPNEQYRFRVNFYFQRGVLSGSFRTLPMNIPPFESLHLPPVIQEIAEEERGIVLVTGTTSSGKSTTLASMIGHINETRQKKIITIEDPIEFLHQDKKSYISQRELGRDTRSFSAALRGALRQDPDVIFLGELRDYETMVTAIRAADTGHLVFSTIHSANASQTVQRLIAMFPANERELLILQLATNLQALISQRLASCVEEKGGGRVPVAEVMRNTPMIRKLIVEGRYSEISSVMAGREQGMQLFDQHLVDRVDEGYIRNREAIRLASNAENVGMMLSGIRTLGMSGGILSG